LRELQERGKAAKTGAEDEYLAFDSNSAMLDYKTAILAICESVENFFDEDGRPITVEDVRSGNLYQDTIQEIFDAYQTASLTGPSEKNAQKPASE
jgi:hypothetical protein